MAFRSSKAIYFCMGFLGGVALALAYAFLGGGRDGYWQRLLLALPGVILWILISLLVALRNERRRQAEVMGWMNNDCRPDKTAEAYTRLLAHSQKKRVRVNLQLNLSTARLNMGDADAARRLLERTAILRPYGADVGGEFVKQNNLAVCCLRQGDLPGAQRALEAAQAFLDGETMTKPRMRIVRESYASVLLSKRYMLAMEKGEYEGAAAYFENRLALAGNALESVGCQYLLGRIYRHAGETQKAGQAFARVRDNGGTSWYAAQAVAFLQAMEAEGAPV